jgi:hypothetical protein
VISCLRAPECCLMIPIVDRTDVVRRRCRSFHSLGVVWVGDLDLTGSEFVPSQSLTDKVEEKKDCFVTWVVSHVL